MYHFVYETTNLINGKKYIGKHSTDDLNDGYLGSGKAIQQAIKKYGENNFSRTILKEFKTSEEAYMYEEEIITPEIIKSKNYYNMKPGGIGGIVMTTEVIAKMKESSAKRFENSPGTVLGTTCYTNGTKNIFIKPGELVPEGFVKGMVHPNRKSRKGCKVKPTTTGTFWVNNGAINKLIQPEGIIPDGFIKGRLMKRDSKGKFSKA